MLADFLKLALPWVGFMFVIRITCFYAAVIYHSIHRSFEG